MVLLTLLLCACTEEGKRQRKDDKHGEEDGDDEKTENEETDVNEQVMEQEGDDSVSRCCNPYDCVCVCVRACVRACTQTYTFRCW